MGKRPNFVYVFCDDLGWGDVSCLNPDSKIQTPHVDALAASGMNFTDAHAGSAVCTPSRYGLLTGRYCWRGKLKNNVLYGYEPPLIEPDRPTVASMLKELEDEVYAQTYEALPHKTFPMTGVAPASSARLPSSARMAVAMSPRRISPGSKRKVSLHWPACCTPSAARTGWVRASMSCSRCSCSALTAPS